MVKRFVVLAFALALFITGFFVYQYWFNAVQVEGKFRAEREKFHVEGQELTTLNPPGPEPMPPTPPPIPVTPADTGAPESDLAAPTPSAPVNPAGAAPASGNVPLDSNTLIGPVPPAAGTPASAPLDSSTPGTAPVPTPDQPAAPATNGAPDSTFAVPAAARLPVLLLGSLTQNLRVQTTDAAPVTPTASSPASLGDHVGTPEHVPAPASVSTNAMENTPPALTPTPSLPAGTRAASVIVLGYHQFSPPGVRVGGKFIYTMPQDVFEYEMKYLADNHYNVVPLSDVVAFARHEKTLPPNTVAITIDDGYKSPLVFAKPILDKYHFPWTFFVYPAFIGNHPTSGYKGAASWPELIELQKEGVDIECHSMTHPNLKSHFQHYPGLAAHNLTPEEYDAFLTNECVTSKQELEQKLGRPIRYFAYPFGNYNPQVEAKAISAGYDAIFTVANNPIHPGSNLHAMGRYIITTPVEKAYVSYLREGALGLAEINPEPGAVVTDPRPVISAVLGYAGTINPASITAEVRDMGEVKCDFDPKTSALRLYLPRDLIDSNVVINIHAKDAGTGQTLTASWRFNYQPIAPGMTHQPIGAGPTATNAAAIPTTPIMAGPAAAATPETNAPAPAAVAPVTSSTNMAAPASTNAP